ncbi:MAG: hypothetical protein Q9203_002484 [Teloschistes exilis]
MDCLGVEWYEVDKSKTKLEVAATTDKDKKPPIPKDKKQGKQYVVDHVLELQVAVAAFKEKKKDSGDKAKAIFDKAWEKGKKRTVLDNLLGVAERVNLGKEAVYKKVLSDKTNESLDKKWNDYLRAIGKYLEDFKSIVDTTIDNTAQALKDLTKDEKGKGKVKEYLSAFCKEKYKEGQDYLAAQIAKLK